MSLRVMLAGSLQASYREVFSIHFLQEAGKKTLELTKAL